MESTVWVNASHPAYERAVASRSEGYHLALAVGLALAPLAVDITPMMDQPFPPIFLDEPAEPVSEEKRLGQLLE